jgi:hypothetical protein
LYDFFGRGVEGIKLSYMKSMCLKKCLGKYQDLREPRKAGNLRKNYSIT